MRTFAILALRALVLLIGLGAVALQVVFIFPVLANRIAQESEVTIVPVRYAILCVALLACVEAALVAVWVLLAMVRSNAIFTRRAFRWVDVIIGAGLLATLLVLGVAAQAVSVALQDDAPELILMAGGVAVSGVMFVLLMVVMRGLLRSATSLQSELAEVL